MYIYTCVDDDELPWKCERPSDVGRLRGVNLVLCLVRSPADDYWYAIDAAADVVGGASAILQVGYLIFRATGNASLFNWEGPNPNLLKVEEGAMVPFVGPTERGIVAIQKGGEVSA